MGSEQCRYPDHHVEHEEGGMCDRAAEAMLAEAARREPTPQPPSDPAALHECQRCPHEWVPADETGMAREMLMGGECPVCEGAIKEIEDTWTIDMFGGDINDD